MKLLLLLLFYSVFCVHANVFEKYIQLKRSLKQSSLPAYQLPPETQSSIDPDIAKSENEMRAAMLAKPSNNTRKSKQTKLASGHTFIPSVITNNTRHVPNATKASPTPQKRQDNEHPHNEHPHNEHPHSVVHESEEQPIQHDVHSQHVVDAVVGQGGRAGHQIHHEQPVMKNPWSDSKAVPFVVLSLLVWACAIASKKTGARRKARVLKKRLTNPRMVA